MEVVFCPFQKLLSFLRQPFPKVHLLGQRNGKFCPPVCQHCKGHLGGHEASGRHPCPEADSRKSRKVGTDKRQIPIWSDPAQKDRRRKRIWSVGSLRIGSFENAGIGDSWTSRPSGISQRFTTPIGPVGRNPHSPRIRMHVSSSRASPQPARHATSRIPGFPSGPTCTARRSSTRSSSECH
jgi:hypothetical protein